MNALWSRSKELQQRAAKVLPLGVNSNFRYWGEGITPYMQKAKGAYLWDVDGNKYLSQASKNRIEQIIGRGSAEGATVYVDGRNTVVKGYERGSFVRPTIIANLQPNSEVARTEIFGPVLGLMHVNTVDEALTLVNGGQYGNQASVFTSSGSVARRFRCEADAGNIGVNIGMAAPMAFFPFSGWRESFFGDLHGQGTDVVEFFTQKKVVVERWPKEWLRKF